MAALDRAASLPTGRGVSVRLLGRPEVSVDGVIVALPPRERALVALLALAAGRVVAIDEIIDALWVEPPATARGRVHVMVSGLRRALESGRAAAVIASSDPGYVLALESGRAAAVIASSDPGYVLDDTRVWVDVREFESRAQRARERPPEEAADMLDAALALWRGEALAGVTAPFAEPVRASLEEQRLRVVEERFRCRLSLGRHEELVAELVDAVGRYPLREQLRECLMLALFGAGRQADALEVYRSYGQMLDAELGLEPGVRLRQLRDDILTDRASVPAPSRKPASDTPAQLPPTVSVFVGRSAELERLDLALLRPDAVGGSTPRIACIVGMGGVGKTALALTWAHRAAAEFPDGQLFVDLRGFSPTPAVSTTAALSILLRTLGVAGEEVPVEIEEQAAMYRSILAARRMLVVLDNAREVEQVRMLLPGSPGSAVLVTSRADLKGLAASHDLVRIRLSCVAPEESVRLLTVLLSAAGLELQPEVLDRIADRCAHLPLALRVAAALLSDTSRSSALEYIRRLEADERLPVLDIDGDPRAAVGPAFELSYSRLAPAERRLFRLLAIAPSADVDAGSAAAVLGTEARQALLRLVDVHLLAAGADGRFVMHDLLREYGRWCAERDEPSDQRGEAVERLLDFYHRSATTAVALVCGSPPVDREPVRADVSPMAFGTVTSAQEWLEAELTNLLAAARYAAEHGPLPWAWELARALVPYSWIRRTPVDWLALADIGLAAARRADEPVAMAAMHKFAGIVHWSRGALVPARTRFEEALVIDERLGQWNGVADNLSNIAGVVRATGELDRAISLCRRAIVLHQQVGNRRAEANDRLTLGMLYYDQGRLAEARTAHRDCLAVYEEIGYVDGQVSAVGGMSEICRLLGELDEAVTYGREAWRLARQGASTANLFASLDNLVTVLVEVGRISEAEQALSAPLPAGSSGADSPYAELWRLLAGARLAMATHRKAQAVEEYRAAAGLSEAVGDVHMRIDALLGLAEAQRALDAAAPIDSELAEALALARAGGLRLREANTLTVTAELAAAAGDLHTAVSAAAAAAAIHQETGSLPWLARARRAAGED
jgi:DNA-binding SARP family transcriptional activator